MGVKGIYDEVGPGKRVALSKLAVEKFEETGRPLRIAVDLSIWLFQIQSGQGGANPALRTFYYRLLKLMTLSIQPLFIFDGPDRPTFKRNRRVATGSSSVVSTLAGRLLDLFGFPYYTAPGEAEAECAFLQHHGVVDAVLSEDVDALLFGCTLSLRHWSSEGSRGSKSPTHVSVHDVRDFGSAEKKKLEKEGMILIALMSGGDYIPAGVPKCGIRIASEAAHAGFGKSLCAIARGDTNALRVWREELCHELHTNERKLFRTRHKAIEIPDSFPDSTVLGYYTNPRTSTLSQLRERQILWDASVDVKGLRSFVDEFFEWQNRAGARKFIRGLAPALLMDRLLRYAQIASSKQTDANVVETCVKALLGLPNATRQHFSTDGLEEIRVAFVPLELVPLNLHEERSDNEDEDAASSEEEEGTVQMQDEMSELPSSSQASQGARRRQNSAYDPTKSERIWIMKTFVRLGVPGMYHEWSQPVKDAREYLNRKEAGKNARGSPRKTKRQKDTAGQGSMDRFVKITKPHPGSLPVSRQQEQEQEQVREEGSDVTSSLPSTPRKSQYSKPIPDSNWAETTLKTPETQRTIVSDPISISSSEDSSKKREGKRNPWTMAKNSGPVELDRSSDIEVSPSKRQTRARKDVLNSRPKERKQPLASSSVASSILFVLQQEALAQCLATSDGTTPSSQAIYEEQRRLLEAAQSDQRTKAKDNDKPQDSRQEANSVDVFKDAKKTDGTETEQEGDTVPQNTVGPDEIDLPALTELLKDKSAPSRKQVEAAGNALHSKGVNRKKAQFIFIRKSLEGSWKQLDEAEARRHSRTWDADKIETIDLADD